jgi:hypothetical protein
MHLEYFIYAGLLAAIVFAVVALSKRRQLAALAAVVTFAVTSTGLHFRPQVTPKPNVDVVESDKPQETEPPTVGDKRLVNFRPIEVLDDGYVSSKVCRECHEHEHATWHASYHRTMTQVPTSDAVILGDFADQKVSVHGRSYYFKKSGDQLWVEMDHPDAPINSGQPRAWCPIVLTTGSHHMQVYWYPTGNSRQLAQVPLVYLKSEQQWVPRRSVFLTPPSEATSSETGRWNDTCIGCHATRGQPRLGPSLVDTQVTEFGIACEACHGPGKQHVLLHDNVTLLAAPKTSDSIVNPAALSHQLSAQVCGQCHSVRNSLSPKREQEYLVSGESYRPGEELGEAMHVVRRNEETRQYLRQFTQFETDDEAIREYFDKTFWPDGMVRIPGREYSGLIESACHQQGTMSCLSCHTLHKPKDDPREMEEWANDQLIAGMEGDQGCIQCHSRDQYAGSDHTHHVIGSSGSRCYNCHMPHTTYGLLKAIRSHQIDSPNVSVSVEFGRPNACNLCHLDKTLAWSAENLESWYGIEKPQLAPDQQSISAAATWALRGDAGQRALIAWSMGWRPAVDTSGADWLPPYLITLLDDPYDAVRFIAHRSLKRIDGFENLKYDFVAPESERQAVAVQTMQAWHKMDHLAIPLKNAVLMDSAGRLNREVFDRLKRHRDDRHIWLIE